MSIAARASCVLVAINIACFNPSSPAFSFEKGNSNWTHKGAQAMGEDFEICATGFPAGAVAKVKAAAAKWNYSKFKFTFKADGCSGTSTLGDADGINQVDFGVVGAPELAGAVSALYPEQPFSDKMIECDIRFNSASTWHTGNDNPPANKNDVFSTALHEFGHCLGLWDTTTAAVMEGALGPGQVRRDLTQDDKDGRAAIYGK
jgi:hypothetical protein